MIRTVKVLCLGALIVASMAVAAGSAQAAQWLVLESVGGNVIEAGKVELEAETLGILHSKIAGVAVLFECPTLTAVNANIATGGKIAEGAKVKFSGCSTKLNGTTSAACEPNAGGTEAGVINTNAGHAVFVLHELEGGVKDELTQIAPDTGETFATIEMGEECSIGEKVPVIGKGYLKDCENAFLVHKEKHLVEQGPLTELWVISKTAEHVANILGSAWAKVRFEGLLKHFAAHAG